MKLLKRIYFFINNKRINKKQLKRNTTIKNNTILLKIGKRSDIDRWKDSKELFEDWNERTSIIASYIDENANIIEFGVGNMSLKNQLPANCTYTPSDIVKRSADTLICDLNELIPFDLLTYNTAVFSGVLEYVYEIDKIFEQLQPHIDNIILSYACSDICKNNRLVNGWLSDYTQNQMIEIFNKFDFQVIDKQDWRQQTIFNLKKVYIKYDIQ